MRVLVVEDESTLAAAVSQGLTAEGYAVDGIHDGAEGLLRASDSCYDAIVLDIMLPGLSGYEVLRRLRAAHVWTPVLMLTAKDGEHDIADALDLGADDYLVKPFSYVVLIARLRALLRRGAPERPVQLVAGDLLAAPAPRRCSRGEAAVELTSREFAVLEYLMRSPDRVISKTELIEHVWDEYYDGDPNIVEVYVGYLRRKVDTPFGRQAIETVRGSGYRVRADGG